MNFLSTCTVSILCVVGLADLMLAQQPANKPGEVTLQSIPKPKILSTMPVPTPDSMKAAQAKYFDWFAKYRTVGALSSARPGDHEDAGLLNDGEGAYTGVFAVHRIYAPSEFHLPPPAGASDVQTLFAPTTRATGGACLEVGTAYTSAPGADNTAVEVYAFDFCKPGNPNWGVHIPVTPEFVQNYVVTNDANQKVYALAIFTADNHIAQSSAWHAQLYNFKKKDWDEIYSSRGIYKDDLRGWSIFETWYQPGQCSPSLPELSASGLAYYEPTTKVWQDLASSMTLPGGGSFANYAHTGGSCFVADLNPASYRFKLGPQAQNTWSVSSTGH